MIPLLPTHKLTLTLTLTLVLSLNLNIIPKQAQTLKLIMIRTSAGRRSLVQILVSGVTPYLAGRFR